MESIDWMTSLPIAAGSVFIVFAGFKILKHGLSMLFWILMLLVGTVGIGIGLNQEKIDQAQVFSYIKEEIQPEKLLEELPTDTLKSLCEKI